MDDEAVGWSESFNATTATYTAPSTITSVKTVTVTATCTPGGATGTATITLQPLVISSDRSSLGAGQVANLTSNESVAWSAAPASVGTLTTLSGTSATYTAPNPISTPATITITGTAVNGGAQASTTIALSATTVIWTPVSLSFNNAGRNGSATITTSVSSATWTVSNNTPGWIYNVSPITGTGNGTITFTVAANSGGGRTGTPI